MTPTIDTQPETFAAFPVAELHAVKGDGIAAGTFEAIVSTFNTVVPGMFNDQVLRPGCFARSLTERGYPAIVWDHEWTTPPIGVALEASERGEEGLYVKGRLFVEDAEDSPTARQVYTAMSAPGGDGRPALREFSIGFQIVQAGWEVIDEEEVLAITDVELWECGPTLVGRNTSRLMQINSHRPPQPSTDPVLQRFPRPNPLTDPDHSCESRHAVRALQLARPRHTNPKEHH